MSKNIEGERVMPNLVSGEWCVYVDAGQYPDDHGGFVPSVVVKDEAGHYPMLGKDGASPWVWGPDYKSANKVAEEYNRDRLGLTQDQVDEIIISSMTARRD